MNEDDIALYADESRGQVFMTLHHLRQQGPKPKGKPHHCLADWIAPVESGVAIIWARSPSLPALALMNGWLNSSALTTTTAPFC